MLVDLVSLTDDEIGLIRDALKSKYLDLVGDMIDYDVDNEDEQEEIKALLKKLDDEEKQGRVNGKEVQNKMTFDYSGRVFKVIDTNNKERFFYLSVIPNLEDKQVRYFYEVHEILKVKHELKLILTLVYESRIYSDEYVFELILQESGIDYKNIEEVNNEL